MGWFDTFFPWRRRRRAPQRVLSGPMPSPPRDPPSVAKPASMFTTIGRRLDSLVNSLSGLGGQYDKGTTARPDTARLPLAFNELTALYRFNGYAQRFIDSVPADATRKGWRLRDDTETVNPLETEEKRLLVKERFREAIQWGRLYGGGLILIVVEEEVLPHHMQRPWNMLQEPLDLNRVKRVLNLVTLDPSEAQPSRYDSDPRSIRFRDPDLWQVSPTTSGSVALAGGQQVHHSRLLYFPGKRLPATQRYANRGIDDSVLEAIWDQVRNRTSVDQAGALIAQELKVNVMKIEGLKDLSVGEQADLFEMRMKILAKSKSLNNMVLLGDGEDFQTLATPMAGFENLDQNSREALCAVTGMPAQLLFGDTPGGLNADGESHRSLWGNVIASFQADRLREPLTYLYTVLYAAKEGSTGGQTPASWSIEFEPLDELTEGQQADLELKQAQADEIRVNAGILPPDHIAKSRYGDAGYQTRLLPFDPAGEDAAALSEAKALMGARPALTLVPNPGAPTSPLTPTRTDMDAMTAPEVEAFAEKLTLAGVPRCEHGSSNRCRICGIERVRDFEIGQNGKPVLGSDGQPKWLVKWRPIYQAVAEPGAGEVRTDAGHGPDDAVIVLPLPQDAADAFQQVVARVQELIGPIEVETRPHVTILFLGPIEPPALAIATSAMENAAVSTAPKLLWAQNIRTFPAPDGEPVPIILEIEEAWVARLLNERLLRALAHVLLAEQHENYVPHLTLGYARTLTETQRAALSALSLPGVDFPATQLELRTGRVLRATAAFAALHVA